MLVPIDSVEIAIIGMAGRFPGARSVDEFWRNLSSGIESVTFFSDEELEALGVETALLRDPSYVKAAALMDGADLFDASFFGFNPREAELMDPQHRVLLECAWEALENAGYDSETYKGAIGVFAGATINTYLLLNLASNPAVINSFEDVQINVSNGGDFLTTRISYKLNLKGPSHLVQSACSTSLVAIHIACQSLLNEESDLALAGGVSINEKMRRGYLYDRGGMVSPDGHCRAFDAGAQGTIFGSGVGVVALKRLEDALADGDTIHAVIKGSAVNNDGSLKVGYTAPSVEGQAGVISEALANARVASDTITYVEAHGTGTPLGDPIEIQALTKAFSAQTDKKGFCAIGSVKTNVGHLDAAAGVTGLIKTVLALEHKQLPPSLHFREPNPQIDFSNSPFYVNTKLTPWEPGVMARRAGVSAFGVGGTNAHVILEEAPRLEPPPEPLDEARPYQLIALSAKTSAALDQAAVNLADYLRRRGDVNPADVAYTLQVGRRAFSHRRMLVCRDTDDAAQALESADPRRIYGDQARDNRQVVFMFPGQGSQYLNMGRQLYEQEKIFREQVDRCSEMLDPHLERDIRDVLYPNPERGQEQAEEAARLLDQTSLTQPALFVIEYALATLLMRWVGRPRAMIGHSLGEYVAACLAEVMTLEDAVRLVAARGQLMQKVPAGAMLSVPLPERDVERLLGGGLSLAAINGPSSCVVSGPTSAIERLAEKLAGSGLPSRRLQTSHAFHSEMMEPAAEAFAQVVKDVRLNPPRLPFISNVTGTWISDEEAMDGRYWSSHLRQGVRFGAGVRLLLEDQAKILVEVGPGHQLSRIVRRQFDEASASSALTTLAHEDEGKAEIEYLLTTLGRLWLAGAEIDWLAFYEGQKRRRMPLPTYPFERQRYWIEPGRQASAGERESGKAGKKREIEQWFYIPSWKRTLGLSGAEEEKQSRQKWMVMEDEQGIGEQMAGELIERGREVIRVKPGRRRERRGESEYEIEASRREDYEWLVRGLAEEEKLPDVIAHLWSVGEIDQREPEIDRFKKAQATGLFSLIFLAQALEKAGVTSPIRILVASDNIRAITHQEALQPEKTTLIGACLVIPQEYPNIACKCVDFAALRRGPGQMRQLVKQLLGEAVAKTADIIIAYRGAQRWAQTFEQAPLKSAGDVSCGVREKGVYLITNGLEGIGFSLAQHLAKSARARLILIEAPGFPEEGAEERPEEGEWSERSGQDEISRKVCNLEALRQMGAKALVVGADLSSEDQIQSAILRGIGLFGELNGVIHAAGVAPDRAFKPIAGMEQTECEWDFEPKVYALYAMEKALRGRKLDFCLLDSSLSSILGGIGYAAYAAANAFLDAFVYSHNQASDTAWVSINWDAWRFDGDGRSLTSINPDLAQLALSVEEGTEAFRRILSASAVDQVIVSTGDLSARIDQWLRTAPLESESQAKPSSPLHPRPTLQNPYVTPVSELERAMAKVWGELLGIESAGVTDNFFDLGGDSLLAVQLISRLRKELGVEVPVAGLYEDVTIRSLIESLGLGQVQDETAGEGRSERALRRKQYQEKQRTRKKGVTG